MTARVGVQRFSTPESIAAEAAGKAMVAEELRAAGRERFGLRESVTAMSRTLLKLEAAAG